MTSRSAASLSLTRLSANEARARTLIARHGASCKFDLAPIDGAATEASISSWRVAFSPGANEAIFQAATRSTRVEWAGGQWWLALPAQAYQAWIAARFSNIDPGELPEPLLDAAWETLLGEMLAALSASLSGPVRRLPRQDDALEQNLPHVWTLTLRSEATGETIFAVLRTDALGLMLLAGLVAKGGQVDNDLDLDQLPVVLRAAIGRTWLSAGVLRTLALHDVVLIDHYFLSEDRELWWWVSDGYGLRVKREGASYIVTKGWTKLMNDSSLEPTAATADDAQPLVVDELPIRLSFDLGERVLALSEVRKLQPGEVFDLDRPLADGGVCIRANGALVGRGELVDIEGRIGVVIRELGKSAS